MDCGNDYVKMCEKATEIQKSRLLIQKEYGDVFFTQGKRCVWLPRQEDLQKMIGDYSKCLNLIHDFQCPEVNFPYELPVVSTMEQLWLCFGMKELYHKEWDSSKEEWIKEGT